MEQKLSDTLVKVVDRSNPLMQNLQLAARFNKLIDEGGGSDVDLEDNKDVTINVSEYTDPVGVIPTKGKDGMKKVTVALSNIPEEGSHGLYLWIDTEQAIYDGWTPTPTPKVGDKFLLVYNGTLTVWNVTAVVDEDHITVNGSYNLARDNGSHDIFF